MDKGHRKKVPFSYRIASCGPCSSGEDAPCRIALLYSHRIRRLVDEVSLNLAWFWYVGYELDKRVPDHTIFSKIRRIFDQRPFAEAFKHILRKCVEGGLVKGDSVFARSTLVKANASMSSLVEVKLSPEVYWRELESSEEVKRPRGRAPKEKRDQQVGLVILRERQI